VNDAFMDEERSLEDPSALKAARYQVEGTAPLTTVAVVKNSRVIHEESAGNDSVTGEYVDKALTADTDSYYLRVLQEDSEMAWSSPVWVIV